QPGGPYEFVHREKAGWGGIYAQTNETQPVCERTQDWCQRVDVTVRASRYPDPEISGNCRVLLAKAGRLLKSVGQLKNADVLLVAADDLQPDGKSFRSKPRGNRRGRIPGRRYVPAGLHPVDITLKFHPRDFSRIRLLDFKGRH